LINSKNNPNYNPTLGFNPTTTTPQYVSANGENGATVYKYLHRELYENLIFVDTFKFKKLEFTTETEYSNKYRTMIYDIHFKNHYSIIYSGTICHITKTTLTKVFTFSVKIESTNNGLEFYYGDKNKFKKFINGKKVKMKMYSPHQLGYDKNHLHKVS